MGEDAGVDVGERTQATARAGLGELAPWRVVAPGVQSRAADPSALAAQPHASAEAGTGRGRGLSGGRGGRGLARRRVRALIGLLAVIGAVAIVGALGLLRPATLTGAVPDPTRPSGSSSDLLTEEPDRSFPAAPGPPSPAPVATPPARSESAGPAGPPEAASDQVPAVDPLDPSELGADWWSILEVLDARRQRALTERDQATLTDYLVPGSPAWRADSGLIAELRGQGLRPVGLATHIIAIEGVEVGRADPEAVGGSSSESGGEASSGADGSAMDRATIVLVDQRSGYTLVDEGGVVVHAVETPGTQRWQVTLVRSADTPEGGDGAWRITQVDPLV